MTPASTTLERPADAVTTVPSRCCEREVRQVDVITPESMLTFTFCSGCETPRWFRDGVPIDRDDLELSGLTGWSRRRAA
jgi:hypothetical protein